MAKNIIFILTEGDHDSAFIYRILKANDMKTNHKIAIKLYPPPLDKLIEKGATSVSIEELNMEQAHSKFLPSYIMEKDDSIIPIYKVGGDSKDEIRIKFIKSVKNWFPPNKYSLSALENKDTRISILFFLDADDKGVTNRIDQIKEELKKTFSEEEIEDINKIENKKTCLVFDINIGAFIFTENNKDAGKLEDILIPLMEKENSDIFDKAKEFIGIHKSTQLFKDKLKYNDNGIIIKVNKKDYCEKKSLIGTVGQLQVSGTSNTVCIAKTDYLNDDKIKSNETCNDIYDFIQKFTRLALS
jgi:hypothetical protein